MSTGPAADLSALKARMRDTWMAGDFGQIARHIGKAADDFVARLNIAPGARVLDVACGTGNTAIPAARRGADVTGVDIAPNLLAQARERAAEEQLRAEFDEGDAEQLPYPDSSFDVVLTMFGAMFAPRPERVAAELVRVCRLGGLIGMANWTPRGFAGRMFAVTARHVPPPPGISAPVLWGDEAVVRERFGSSVTDLHCTPVMAEMNFPMPPTEVVQFFKRYFGPTQAAFARLDAEGQAALQADLEAMWSENNLGGPGSTVMRSEYLEVQARKA